MKKRKALTKTPKLKLNLKGYFKYKLIASKGLTHKKSLKALKKIKWEHEANAIAQELIQKLNSIVEAKEKILVCDIRWEDATSQSETVFAYDTSKNIKDAFAYGMDNSTLIDYSAFIKKNLECDPEQWRETLGEDDYEIWVNLLVKLSCEVFLNLIKTSFFKEVKKQNNYYLSYCLLHDTGTIIYFNSKKPKYSLFAKNGDELNKKLSLSDTIALYIRRKDSEKLLNLLVKLLKKKEVFDVAQLVNSLITLAKKKDKWAQRQITLAAETCLKYKSAFDGFEKNDRHCFDILEEILIYGLALTDQKKPLADKVAKKIPMDWMSKPFLPCNLACNYALYKKKRSMIPFLVRALELGMQPTLILDDPDFVFYKNDQDFLKILKSADKI